MTSIFNTSWEYLRMHFFVILAQICDQLWCGQVKLPRIQRQNGPNDLEDQGQWPPFSTSTESITWCIFGTNLVTPAQIYDELSYEQGKVYGRTDRWTDESNDNSPSAWKARGKNTLASTLKAKNVPFWYWACNFLGEMDQYHSMLSDNLEPCVARSSAAMVLTVQDKRIHFFHTRNNFCTTLVSRNDIKWKCVHISSNIARVK